MELQELIRRARAGDSQALAGLLLRYRRYLSLLARLYVRQRLRSKVDPSDLAQEACLEAVVSFESFCGETPGEFTEWLKQILATKGLRHIRQYCQTQSRNAALHRLSAAHSSPSQATARNETAVQLADALASLSGTEREIIIQHGLEGATMAEVAQRLDRSVDSAWKVWTRGLLKLRRLLAEN